MEFEINLGHHRHGWDPGQSIPPVTLLDPSIRLLLRLLLSIHLLWIRLLRRLLLLLRLLLHVSLLSIPLLRWRCNPPVCRLLLLRHLLSIHVLSVSLLTPWILLLLLHWRLRGSNASLVGIIPIRPILLPSICLLLNTSICSRSLLVFNKGEMSV